MADLISGVYSIEQVGTGRRYIGSSRNVAWRFYVHLNDLGRGRHHSRFLQRAFNAHGIASFVFWILERCDPSMLTEREQFYIDSLCPVFNSAERAGHPPVRRGHKLTQERKDKNGAWWNSLSESERAAIREKRSVSLRAMHAARTPDRQAKITEKIAASNRGKSVPEERRRKIAATLQAMPLTEEHKARLRRMTEANTGARYVRKLNDETISTLIKARNSGMSWRAVGAMFGIHHASAQYWYERRAQ